MAKVFNRSIKLGGQKQTVNGVSLQVLEYDGDGKILLCKGNTVPAAGSSGFAKGCLFTKTDATANVLVYVNEGSSDAANFNAIPSGASVTLTPDDADGVGVNMIPAGVSMVSVGANVNGVNDWITLPSLADVPNGFTVTVVSNAAGHEVRTPAGSDEEINSENCDGTKEYAIASGNQIHRFTKINNTIGWMGQGFTALGAVVTAVIPD
jgi:hypothetical protein